MNYFKRGELKNHMDYKECFEEDLVYFRNHSEFFDVYLTKPRFYTDPMNQSLCNENIQLFFLGEITFDKF